MDKKTERTAAAADPRVLEMFDMYNWFTARGLDPVKHPYIAWVIEQYTYDKDAFLSEHEDVQIFGYERGLKH